MDLVRALKFPLDDEDWPVKIAIGSLVTLIPVVGWIGSLGYQVSVARNVIRGSARPLPGSDDLGQIFSDGVMAGIAALLYAIPMIPFWCMMALLSGIADGSSAGDFALACLSVGAVVLSIVYSIPAAAMYWIGVMNYTQTGNFSEFTQFGALFREARAHIGTLVMLFLYNFLVGLILAVISPLAVITCVGIFVLAFYSQIASGHLIGQAGREIVRGY
ncbi:MAG: DUF4013 domain-containing protein [Chloroflexi bacterium]|nr:DUF4013 domain-containing protein [Chloroflexota bacterium]